MSIPDLEIIIGIFILSLAFPLPVGCFTVMNICVLLSARGGPPFRPSLSLSLTNVFLSGRKTADYGMSLLHYQIVLSQSGSNQSRTGTSSVA